MQAKRIDCELHECYSSNPHEILPQLSKLIEQGMCAYAIGVLLFALENFKTDKVKRRGKVLEIYGTIRQADLDPAAILPKALHSLAEKARALKS